MSDAQYVRQSRLRSQELDWTVLTQVIGASLGRPGGTLFMAPSGSPQSAGMGLNHSAQHPT